MSLLVAICEVSNRMVHEKPLNNNIIRPVMNITKYRLSLLICLLICICCVLNGCGGRQKSTHETIVVSIAPLKYIAEIITTGDFPISVLVPEGTGPETYSPTPLQILETESSKLFLVTGLIDFEKELAVRLDKVLKNSNIVNLSEGIELIEGSCSRGEAADPHGHDHNAHNHKYSHNSNGHGAACPHHGESQNYSRNHHHHHGVDPHIWTSPDELKIMAKNAFAAIAKAWPDSLAKYTAGYEALIKELDELSLYVADAVSKSGVTHFMVYHPALTYYARDYGLEQLTIEEEGKEPSVMHMQEIVREARKHGIEAIMYQREFPRSVVESTARETGARIVEINPLSDDIPGEIIKITNVITNVIH